MKGILKTTGALLLLLGLAGCVAVPPEMSGDARTTGADDRPVNPTARFRAVALQSGDELTIDQRGTADAAFDITSERGIGQIEFERLGAAPATLAFRLHLKGLEQFTLTWGDNTATVNYPSSGGPRAMTDPADPLAMLVTVEADNPTIPLQEGHFVVIAPAQFIEDAPQRFSIQWIDFYR